MADNTILNSGTGGDTVRDIDRSGAGIKTQVVQLDFGGANTNAEQLVSGTNPLPTKLTDGTNAVAVKAASTAAAATDPSIVVNISPNSPAHPVTATNATAANFQATVTQALGTAGTRWFAQLSDGTNSPAVKAASTAAAATDPALTVSFAGANSATKIGDGTNNAVIAAASAQPAFTNAALVVADRATGASAAAIPSSIMFAGGTFTNTQPTVTSGNLIGLQTTSRGALLVSLNSADNSATAAGFVKLTDGTTAVPVTAASTASAANAAALNVSLSPNSPTPATTSANQACTPFIANAVGAASSVKGSAGNVFGFSLINNNAATVFVEFFNSASPTLGTTTPVAAYVIPASGTLTVSPSNIAHFNCATAISMAAVTAYNGSTTGSVTGTVFYK